MIAMMMVMMTMTMMMMMLHDPVLLTLCALLSDQIGWSASGRAAILQFSSATIEPSHDDDDGISVLFCLNIK